MPELLGESGGANGASGSSRLLNGVNGVPLRQRSRRKQSSPMMPPFMVSAPGKVIVFGEHAVVHGKVSPLRILGELRAQLASAVDSRKRADARRRDRQYGKLTLSFFAH